MELNSSATLRRAPTSAAQQAHGEGMPEPALVLIVDDEEPILETLVMIVEEMGFQASRAANGEEAMGCVHRQWPALIITDMMMPRLDGAQFIAALQAAAQVDGRPTPPIILLTAGMSPHLQHIGASSVLAKPFKLEDIEALIRRFLP